MNYQTNSQKIIVYVEGTNNDFCYNFVPNVHLLDKNKFKVFHRISTNLEESKLVVNLLERFPEIEEIFATDRNITVSFIYYWRVSDDYLNEIKNTIKMYFEYSDSFLDIEFRELKERIEIFLEEYINPSLAMDGGAYKLHNYSTKNKHLVLKSLGSCRNNVSNAIDFVQIKNIIKRVYDIEIEIITAIIINN